eukprot:m.72782 g.72782  ORF g.72782 m.72782 type:complete len:501 (-) comp14281_c0_seq2:25-1527(-)
MYLLEAKKKAEKEEKAQRERERRKAKKQAQRDETRDRAQAALDAKRKEAEAKEQSMMEEAMRRSKLSAQESGQRQRMASSAADLPRGGAARPIPSRQPQVLRKPSPKDSPKTSPGQQRRVVASAPLKDPKSATAHNPDDEWRDVRIKCSYLGTFEVGTGSIDRAEIKKGIALMEGYSAQARPAQLMLTLAGIKVMDSSTDKTAMAHALQRISMSSIVAPKALFGFVAKNPGSSAKYCHVFKMSKPKYAESAQALVGKAFKMAFAKDRTMKKPLTTPAPDLPTAADLERRSLSASTDSAEGRRWAKQNALPGRGQARTPSVMPTVSPANARMGVAKGQDLVMAPVEDDDDNDAVVMNDDGSLGGDFLRNAPWYQEGLPREVAMELISSSQEGAFIVRDSQSQPGCYALTMKARGEIRNYVIKGTSSGYIIGTVEDGEKPYRTLAELILAHAERRGVLPLELSLDTENQLYSEEPQSGPDRRDSYVDPDYQSVLTWEQMSGP